MPEKEKKEKDKINFKVISSETSVNVPGEENDEDIAIKDLLKILKPKISAPKPTSAKPISLSEKKVKSIAFSPVEKPQSASTQKIPRKGLERQTKESEIESDILVTDKLEEEDVSEDLLKMSEILQGIKEDEIAERLEEKPPMDIPENVILGIQIECPHCARRILLDKLEFLKQGYSDYCPHCNLMLLPNILPEDYVPIESSEPEE